MAFHALVQKVFSFDELSDEEKKQLIHYLALLPSDQIRMIASSKSATLKYFKQTAQSLSMLSKNSDIDKDTVAKELTKIIKTL